MEKTLENIGLGFGTWAVLYYFGYRYYLSIANHFSITIPIEELLPSQTIFMKGFEFLYIYFIALLLIKISTPFLSGLNFILRHKLLFFFKKLFRITPELVVVTQKKNRKFSLLSVPLILEQKTDSNWEQRLKSVGGQGEKQMEINEVTFAEHFKVPIIPNIKNILLIKDSISDSSSNFERVFMFLLLCAYIYICAFSVETIKDNPLVVLGYTYGVGAIFIVIFFRLLSKMLNYNLLLTAVNVIAFSMVILFSKEFIENERDYYDKHLKTIDLRSVSSELSGIYEVLFENNHTLVVFEKKEKKVFTVPKRKIEWLQNQ